MTSEIELNNSTRKRKRCPYGCGKWLAPRTIEYHRSEGCRSNQSDMFSEACKRGNFFCGVCGGEFPARRTFFDHLATSHDIMPEIHNLCFEDRKEFDRFVHWCEMGGGAHFRHKSGSKRRPTGVGIFLACNRSGQVCRNDNDPAKKNKTGSFRIGFSCTAYIHCREHADGTLTAEVCADHYGHDQRMRLPNIIKKVIAEMQIHGEAPSVILSYLRSQYHPMMNQNVYAHRIYQVDFDELRNLLVTTTKKWESTGIPNECEPWEWEILDMGGIVPDFLVGRERTDDKTTQDLAILKQWPVPRTFLVEGGITSPTTLISNSSMISPSKLKMLEDDDYDSMEAIDITYNDGDILSERSAYQQFRDGECDSYSGFTTRVYQGGEVVEDGIYEVADNGEILDSSDGRVVSQSQEKDSSQKDLVAQFMHYHYAMTDLVRIHPDLFSSLNPNRMIGICTQIRNIYNSMLLGVPEGEDTYKMSFADSTSQIAQRSKDDPNSGEVDVCGLSDTEGQDEHEPQPQRSVGANEERLESKNIAHFSKPIYANTVVIGQCVDLVPERKMDHMLLEEEQFPDIDLVRGGEGLEYHAEIWC